MLIAGRLLTAAVLLGVAAFCGFGFLASYEPPGYVPVRVGYAVLGAAAVAGAVVSLIRLGRPVVA